MALFWGRTQKSKNTGQKKVWTAEPCKGGVFLCRAEYSKHGRTWKEEGRVGKGEREIGIQSLRFLWMHEMGDFNPCSCYLSAFITLLCISSPESFQGDLYHLIKYIFFSGKRSLCIQKEKKSLTAITEVCGRKKNY